jgi:hypothetical protein
MEARIDLLLEKVSCRGRPLIAVDDRTVRWALKKPYPKLLVALLGHQAHVVARLPSRVACSRAAAHSPDDEPQSGPHHRPPDRRAIAAASGAQGERQGLIAGVAPPLGHATRRAQQRVKGISVGHLVGARQE